MDAPLKHIHDQIDDATTQLLHTVSALTDDDLRQPSLLPGWTRGRVLQHLVHGAGAMRDLIEGRPARAGDPAGGDGRSVADLLADLRTSAAALREAALAQPEDRWDRPVEVPGAGPVPAGQILVRRLVELELHHVDLDAGYRPADWPTTFNELELTEPMRTQRADRIV